MTAIHILRGSVELFKLLVFWGKPYILGQLSQSMAYAFESIFRDVYVLNHHHSYIVIYFILNSHYLIQLHRYKSSKLVQSKKN